MSPFSLEFADYIVLSIKLNTNYNFSIIIFPFFNLIKNKTFCNNKKLTRHSKPLGSVWYQGRGGKIFVTWIYKNLRSGVRISKLIYITLIFNILSLLKYHNPTSSIFKNLSHKNFPSPPLQIPHTKQTLKLITFVCNYSK